MSPIVKGLKTHFFSDEGVSPAVDGVNLRVHKGETLSPTTWGSLRKVPPGMIGDIPHFLTLKISEIRLRIGLPPIKTVIPRLVSGYDKSYL
jgi:hypothetical protein